MVKKDIKQGIRELIEEKLTNKSVKDYGIGDLVRAAEYLDRNDDRCSECKYKLDADNRINKTVAQVFYDILGATEEIDVPYESHTDNITLHTERTEDLAPARKKNKIIGGI